MGGGAPRDLWPCCARKNASTSFFLQEPYTQTVVGVSKYYLYSEFVSLCLIKIIDSSATSNKLQHCVSPKVASQLTFVRAASRSWGVHHLQKEAHIYNILNKHLIEHIFKSICQQKLGRTSPALTTKKDKKLRNHSIWSKENTMDKTRQHLLFEYESFSDVGESRVWFASKILTPCRMH